MNKELTIELVNLVRRHEEHFPTPLIDIPPEDLDFEPATPLIEGGVSVFEQRIPGQLGIGAYGIVRKATWGTRTVAVKSLPKDCSSLHFRTLAKESLIHRQLGEHGSHYIVEFISAWPKGGWKDLYIVLEYCEHGDLKSYLSYGKHKPVFRQCLERGGPRASLFDPSGPETFSVHTLIDWAHQIGAGLSFLTSKGFLHNDLAAKNVLLTSGNSVKLADFGMAFHCNEARFLPDVSSRHYKIRQDIPSQTFSELTDVFCYGQVLWELFALGDRPPRRTGEELFTGKRPAFCPDRIWDLIAQCVSPDRRERPHFSSIVSTLQDILQDTADFESPQQP